jgi:hypothetical protein
MRSALKWGALVGLGAYLLLGLGLPLFTRAVFATGPADLNHPGILMSACLGIFALLFAFSTAGFFTGRETLKAGYGAVAGMVALAIHSALSAIYTPGRSATPVQSTPSSPAMPMTAQVASVVVAGAVVFGMAALMGWLGARPGEQQGRKRLTERSVSAPTEVSP